MAGDGSGRVRQKIWLRDLRNVFNLVNVTENILYKFSYICFLLKKKFAFILQGTKNNIEK